MGVVEEEEPSGVIARDDWYRQAAMTAMKKMAANGMRILGFVKNAAAFLFFLCSLCVHGSKWID